MAYGTILYTFSRVKRQRCRTRETMDSTGTSCTVILTITAETGAAVLAVRATSYAEGVGEEGAGYAG